MRTPGALALIAIASMYACATNSSGQVIEIDVVAPPADIAATPDARTKDAASPDGGDATARDDARAGDANGPGDANGSGDDAAPSADGGCAPREDCTNGLDDDCDGAVDNGCPCSPGMSRRCFVGPASAAGVGRCERGTMYCVGNGEFGSWSRCEGSVAPRAETCDGADDDCDGRTDEGFCRVAGSCVGDGAVNPTNPCEVCDAPDTRDGATAWSAAPGGTVCRPAAGPCDAEERCAGAVCPDDAFRGRDVECRPSAGPCDVAERCDGAAQCPADAFAPTTTVCRAATGACDVAEACSGSDARCPADANRPAGSVCRPAAGVCDVAEACSGSDAQCPADAFAPPTAVCRASTSVEGCDPAERCTGSAAACPADVVTRAPSAEICDNVDNNCNGVVDEALSRACYGGPAGTAGRGICREGAQTCAAGAWGACVGEVQPRAEVCRNNVDEDCDGAADDSCIPCLTGNAAMTPWQSHRGMGPICFGTRYSESGDPREFQYAVVPAEGDRGWQPVTATTINFGETSELCGRSCECRDGGNFTYFQTFVDVTRSYAVNSLTVSISGVDDGARITVYNTRHPNGVTDANGYLQFGGASITADLARYLVVGRNRIVITHVDDCCNGSSIRGVTVSINGTALRDCP